MLLRFGSSRKLQRRRRLFCVRHDLTQKTPRPTAALPGAGVRCILRGATRGSNSMAENWTVSLERLLERCWCEIADLQTPRGGYSGLVTLATIGVGGGPEMRQVVLRRVDQAVGTVEIHTDARTPKLAQIAADNRASALIWNEGDRLQIRLSGEAEIVHKADAGDLWNAMTPEQRGNYGTDPAPGTAIDAAGSYTRAARRDRLAVLRIMIARIDVVHLDRPNDLRACYLRGDDWRGQWLAP